MYLAFCGMAISNAQAIDAYTREYDRNKVSQHASNNPDSGVHGANMGPTWGRQDPGGPHVDHMKMRR